MEGAVDLADPVEADGAGRVDLTRSLAARVPMPHEAKQAWLPAILDHRGCSRQLHVRSPRVRARRGSRVGGAPLERAPLVRSPLVRPTVVRSFVDRRLGALSRATLGALIAATAVAAIVLWHEVVRDLAPLQDAVSIPWWALAAGFAFTELFVIHAHVRGSAHSLTLSELPLVLGLLLASPSDLVIAMVVGPAVVLIWTRGQGPLRLCFNLAQFALTGVLATIVLHALAGAPSEIGPAVWGATFVAVFVSALTGAVLVFCAIGLSEGVDPLAEAGGDARRGPARGADQHERGPVRRDDRGRRPARRAGC